MNIASWCAVVSVGVVVVIVAVLARKFIGQLQSTINGLREQTTNLAGRIEGLQDELASCRDQLQAAQQYLRSAQQKLQEQQQRRAPLPEKKTGSVKWVVGPAVTLVCTLLKIFLPMPGPHWLA